MPTPLERQILDDFERRLARSDAIPDGLASKLMSKIGDDRIPAAEILLETIRSNVGDQSV